jgi:hypothetical protein
LRAGEEAGAVGEDGGYGRGRYAVVLEIDEAGILEALENGFGGRLLRCGVSGEKLCKVDELLARQKRSIKRAQRMDAYWNDQVVLGDCLFL